jgi:cobalt/nickel transport system ATP-binding protein
MGTIYICSADDASPAEIKNILKKSIVNYVGAMGTEAKMAAYQAKIPLDFTYGVIDKCILKALTGKISLIITSGGMVDHSLRRIFAYNEESGARINTIKLVFPQESLPETSIQGKQSQERLTKQIEMPQ